MTFIFFVLKLLHFEELSVQISIFSGCHPPEYPRVVFGHSAQELGRPLPGKQCVYLAAFTTQGVCGKAPPAIISLGREEGCREGKRYRYLYSQAVSGLWILN